MSVFYAYYSVLVIKSAGHAQINRQNVDGFFFKIEFLTENMIYFNVTFSVILMILGTVVGTVEGGGVKNT